MKVYVIIPAYNEEQTIATVIRGIQGCGLHSIIVVDDGSHDGTRARALSAGVRVIRHCVNCGKGAAIITGVQYARSLRADAVVTIDGDMQHDAKDIKKLVSYLSKKYDVILGSRFLKKNRIPPFRRVSNFIANIITLIFCGVWVSDSQSGMRAYGRKALETLSFEGDRYEFESEALRSMRRTKLRYREVPITVRYTKYSMTKSTRQSFVSGIETFINLIQRT